MAIKINGTTVIDDSRNLVNIASGAGASTAFGAVGSYALLNRSSTNLTAYAGDTIAGSNLNRRHAVYNFEYHDSTAVSGTWRCMGYNSGVYAGTLWVRIS